jgi:hypothetical protein
MEEPSTGRPNERDRLVAALAKLHTEIEKEITKQRSTSERISKTGYFLSIAASVGAGFAGAVVTIENSLSGVMRTAVVLVAFAGAGLSGTAAVYGAPERSKRWVGRWIQLRALNRRLEVIATIDSANEGDLEAWLNVALAWLDQIQGVVAPDGLSLDVGGTTSPHQQPPDM